MTSVSNYETIFKDFKCVIVIPFLKLLVQTSPLLINTLVTSEMYFMGH